MGVKGNSRIPRHQQRGWDPDPWMGWKSGNGTHAMQGLLDHPASHDHTVRRSPPSAKKTMIYFIERQNYKKREKLVVQSSNGCIGQSRAHLKPRTRRSYTGVSQVQAVAKALGPSSTACPGWQGAGSASVWAAGIKGATHSANLRPTCQAAQTWLWASPMYRARGLTVPRRPRASGQQ